MADLTYTLVIRDDGTAVVKKVTAAVKSAGQAGEEMGTRTSKGMRQAHHELSQLDRTLQRLTRTAAAFLGMWVLTKVMAIPREAIESAMEFNSAIETAKLGIASILMAQGEFTSSVGMSVQGYEKLIAAQKLSGEMVRKLQLDNLRTIATFDQLVKAFQQTVAPALERGLNLEQTRKFTVAMVQAAGALGLNLDMLAEETRSLLRGTISPRQTLIATALGITNEDVRRFQGNAGALFDFIMGRLDSFTIAGIESQKTWKGMISNLKDMAKIVLGVGLEDIFILAKREAQAFMDTIIRVNEVTDEMEIDPKVLESIKRLGYLIETVYVTVKDIVGIIGMLRGPMEFLIEAWRSIAISSNTWREALRGAEVNRGEIEKYYKGETERLVGKIIPEEPEVIKRTRGKGFWETSIALVKEYNDYILGTGKNLKKFVDEEYAEYYQQLMGGLKYVVRSRELREDEINYLMQVAGEIGHIDEELQKRLKTDMKSKGINIDLLSYSGKQLQAVIKTVSEYEKLKDTGEETKEAFKKLLDIRLQIAAIETKEIPLKIVQQLAQATDQYSLQEETLRILNRLGQEKLALVKQLTPELKKQMDLQAEFQTAEIDRARRTGVLERQKDLITLRQTYANITGDIDGQVTAMQSLTDIEIGQLQIQLERTKDLEKQKDLQNKILELRRLGAKQAEQFRITAPIEQRAPMYAAGLGVAEAVGNLTEYERISRLILNDEIASLKAKGEGNRYLQDLINYKEQQWKIDLAIRKVELETYAPDRLAQVSANYAEITGDIQAQDRASQMLLAGELKRLQVDAKLNEDQKLILSTMLKQIEASEAVTRALSKEKEILGWRQSAATLQGDYIKSKQLEIELLKNEEKQLLENNKGNQAAVDAIKEYYNTQLIIAEAQKNLDFSKLVDIGAQQEILKLNQQLAQYYQSILPSTVNVFADSLGNLLDNLASGTMSARDAFDQFFTSMASGFRRLWIDILMTIVKMEILKALGYGSGMPFIPLTGGSLGPAVPAQFGGVVHGQPIPIAHFQEGGGLRTTRPTLFTTSERGGTEYIIPEEKMKGMSGQPITLTIVNVVDQRQLDMYMASSRGQNAVVNSVGAQVGIIKKLLR